MKINNSTNSKIKDLFLNISKYLFALFIIPTWIGIIFIGININLVEKVEYIFFNFYWILSFIVHSVIIIFLHKNSNKIQEKHLFIALTLLYLFFATYYFINISFDLRADAKTIYNASRMFSEGKYEFFEKGRYFNYYPHQLGLLYYNYFLTSFVDSSKFIFFVNFIMIHIINYFVYKIVDNLSNRNRRLNLITIYLSFAFLPQLFFMSFAYGTVPGLLFSMIGIYLILKYNQCNDIKYLISSILFFAIACLLRNNYLIVVIAVSIYQWIKHESIKKVVVFTSVFIAINFIVVNFMHYKTEQITGQKVVSGAPKSLWIAMGTDLENEVRGPGWYNSYIYNTMKDLDYNYEESDIVARNKIRENFSKHIQNPVDSISFFIRKHASTWMDPTYQSIWSGPLEIYKQNNNSEFMVSLYNEGPVYWFVYHTMRGMQVLIYSFLIYYIFRLKDAEKKYLIFILYLIGGTIFHIFWETKSQYVYTYIFCMIPLLAESMDHFLVNGLLRNEKRNDMTID